MTLQGALELARRRAPGIVAERLRVDEARGRLVGASVLLRENPVIEGGVTATLTITQAGQVIYTAGPIAALP